jgi:ABC-type phosphate/phosphonate transport system permease subunit
MTDRNLPRTPNLDNLYQRLSLSTQSKALRKSTKQQYNLFLLANVLVIIAWSANTASVVLTPCRNPNWASVIKSYLSHTFTKRLFKTDVNNLQTQLNKLIPLKLLGSLQSPFLCTGMIIAED